MKTIPNIASSLHKTSLSKRNIVAAGIVTLSLGALKPDTVLAGGVHSPDAMDKVSASTEENFGVDARVDYSTTKKELVAPSFTITKGIGTNMEVGLGSGLVFEGLGTKEIDMRMEALFGWTKMQLGALGPIKTALAIGAALPGEKKAFEFVPGMTLAAEWKQSFGIFGVNVGYSREMMRGIDILHANTNFSYENLQVEAFLEVPLDGKKDDHTHEGVRLGYKKILGSGWAIDGSAVVEGEDLNGKVLPNARINLGMCFALEEEKEEQELVEETKPSEDQQNMQEDLQNIL